MRQRQTIYSASSSGICQTYPIMFAGSCTIPKGDATPNPLWIQLTNDEPQQYELQVPAFIGYHADGVRLSVDFIISADRKDSIEARKTEQLL